MTQRPTTWTRELIERRRELHSRIDGIARSNPVTAARARLDLYSTTHLFDTGAIDEASLDAQLAVLELELGARTAAAA